jgi:hypothetical protein
MQRVIYLSQRKLDSNLLLRVCTITLWAATSESLAGRCGMYCEGCDVANVADADSQRYSGGVLGV